MPKEYTTIQIDKELYHQYSRFCKENGKTVTGTIRNFIKREMGVHAPIPSKNHKTLPSVKTSVG